MECNKDEALRAKEIAEKKFLANDIEGAKKFALKAQSLFPPLDGINQMIATLDVYLSSGVKLDGEKDWYSILCINPSADDETVKKQYRKLALQLHPDKNKSVGAEGAFHLISQAWSVLSDKSKKMLYDHKRLGKAFQPKSTTMKKDHSVQKPSNGFCTSSNVAAPKVRPQKSNLGTVPASRGSNPPSQTSKPGTFWTSCNRCKMQYEYLRAYLNLNLLCPNCRQPFVASETVFPTEPNRPAPSSSSTKNDCGASTFPHGVDPNSNLQWGPFSRTAGAASGSATSTAAAQAANVVHQTFEKVRREHEEAQVAARREEAVRRRKLDGNEHALPKADKNTKRKRGASDDPRMNYGGRDALNAGMHPVNLNKPRVFSRKINIRRGYPQVHVLRTLLAKSKGEIHKTVEAWHSAKAAKTAEKENAKNKQKLKESTKEKAKKVNHGNATNRDRVDEPSRNSKQAPQRDSENENAHPEKEMVEPMSIDVPDPDFHDFDKDRTERSFKDDEIWATYDDEDGMPRYYALIQKVLSYKPFKVRMSFLGSKSNSEFGPLNWVASGFAKTSGDFRIIRYEVKDTLNMFSHRVRWEKGLRGVIKIVPRQGEIWALYRNWSPDWNVHTSDEVIYKYDMVEVLEDYSEEYGLSVAPLVKIAGFKTVFHRHLDPNEVKRIPREEMFRFSHQVPSYVLTGEEGHNAPKGCYELDPAATPLELLRVVTESKSGEVMQASELLHNHSGRITRLREFVMEFGHSDGSSSHVVSSGSWSFLLSCKCECHYSLAVLFTAVKHVVWNWNPTCISYLEVQKGNMRSFRIMMCTVSAASIKITKFFLERIPNVLCFLDFIFLLKV